MSSALLLSCSFLLLTSYYVLKTAREGMILAGGAFGLRGDELKAYASGLMAVLLGGLVPLYGQVANRVRRIVLINATYAFFGVCLAVFYVLSRLGIGVGFAFYVWLGIASVFLIAQFWSYAADIYSEDQGERLFPVIAVGGSLGAIVGPKLATLIDTFTLLPVSVLLLVVSAALINIVEQRNHGQPEQVTRAPIAGPGGFSLVLADRYLLLLGGMLVVANIVNTTGEYILSNAVREHALALSGDEAERREIIKHIYGNFFAAVNVMTFVLQSFIVSRMIAKFGVRSLLYVLPVIAAASYSAIALVGGFAVIRIAKLVENSTDYSLQNTLRQTLFLPLPRVAKYKAKAAIDTFCVRAGDLVAAVLVAVGVHTLGMGRTMFALVNIGLVALWIPICVHLVFRHRQRSAQAAGGV